MTAKTATGNEISNQNRNKRVRLREERFVKQVNQEWKKEGVLDYQSGDSEEEEVMGEGIGEPGKEELV